MTTERAPEPTMDEILASIKRIIADEDQGGRDASAPAPFGRAEPAFGSAPDGDDEPAEGDAQLIADIQRALADAGDGQAHEDDVLDLTRVMTEEIALESSEPAKGDAYAPSAIDDDPFDLGSPLRDGDETAPAQGGGDAGFDDDDVFSLESGPETKDDSDVFALSDEAAVEAVVLDFAKPQSEPVEAEAEAETETADDDAWALKSALEDEPAGTDPGDGRKEPLFVDDDIAAEDAPPGMTGETTPEADETMTIFDTRDEEESAPIAMAAPEPEVTPDPAPEPETAASALAGAAPAAASAFAVAEPPAMASAGRSMEETVGEMLRPMLRAWLDENMPRILETTLRAELRAGSLRDD
jgi:cell pole-organizing protein PopZ